MASFSSRTPADRKYALALQLMQNASQPVNHPLQGLANGINTGLGFYMMNKAGKEADARRQKRSDAIRYAVRAGVKGSTDGVISALAGVDDPAIQSQALGLLGKSLDAKRAASVLAEQRQYDAILRKEARGQKLSDAELAHKRAMKLAQVNRENKLSDQIELAKFQQGLRDKAAAAKPFYDAGITPPGVGVMGGTPAAPQPASPSHQAAAPQQQTPQQALLAAQAEKEMMKKEAQEIGKQRAEAKINLPTVEHNAEKMLSVLDKMVAPQVGEGGEFVTDEKGRYVPGKEHPGLENMVGAGRGYGGLTTYVPFVGGPMWGSYASDFNVIMKQVKGKQFLQAFETLKGGGQITEMEGEKATDALARINAAQSEEAFREAVLEFRQEVQALVDIARKKAGGKVDLKTKYGLE